MDFLRYPIREIKLHNEGLSVKASLPEDFLKQSLVDSEVDVSQSHANVSFTLSYIPGGQIQAKGTLEGKFGFVCQRCLDPVSFSFSNPIHAYFLPPGANLPDDTDSYIDQDSAEYATYEGDFVELAPFISEQLLLSIPMTILCKEECRGLCPSCGENRNVQLCDCKEAPSLSSFAKLKNFSLKS